MTSEQVESNAVESGDVASPTAQQSRRVSVWRMMFWVGVAVCLPSFWWLLTAASSTPIPKLSGQLGRGQQAFREAGCWNCHHPTQKGARWGAGFGAPRSHVWWVGYLRKPRVMHANATKQTAGGLLMKDAKGHWQLNERGQDLVSYVRYLREWGMGSASSLRVRSTSRPPLAGMHQAVVSGIRTNMGNSRPQHHVNPSQEGPALYAKFCSKCHGAKGRGNGPLAADLPTKPRDLVQTQQYACRSSKKNALGLDLRRTILRGTGGCGVVPLDKLLSSAQLDALVNTVRALAMVDSRSNTSTLVSPSRTTPNRGAIYNRAFQRWSARWWKARFKAWKARYGSSRMVKKSGNSKVFRQMHAWRTWLEWKGFEAWVKAKPNRLMLSQNDWRAHILRLHPYRIFAKRWRESGSKDDYFVWLRQYKMKDILKRVSKDYQKSGRKDAKRIKWWKIWKWATHRSEWISKRADRRYRDELGNIDYNAYREWQNLPRKSKYKRMKNGMLLYFYFAWREKEERLRFRQWKDQQQKLLFMAWRGQSTFMRLGCQKCHQTPAAPNAKMDPKHSRDLRDGRFRCGSGPHDVYRSIALGVGKHMPGLSQQQMFRYLRVTSLYDLTRKKKGKQAKKGAGSLWDLVAYVRFLSGDLPILQAVPRDILSSSSQK